MNQSRNNSLLLRLWLMLLAPLLCSRVVAADPLLADLFRKEPGVYTRIHANGTAQTGSNMSPHPEMYLQGGPRGVAWQGSTGDAELQLVGQQKSITDVTVINSTISERGVSGLAASGTIVRADIKAKQPLGDEALAGWDNCRELTELTIGPVRWSEKSFALLAALPKLRKLTIVGGTITGRGIARLSNHKILTHLALQGVDLKDSGFAEYHSPALYMLDVNGCKLSPADVENLAKLTSLAGLDIGATNLEDADMPKLLTLEKLASLTLAGTVVSFEGALQLKGLKKLNWVRYDGPPNVTWPEAGVQLQRLADTLGWTFEGACSCGCCDISPTPKPNPAAVVAPR